MHDSRRMINEQAIFASLVTRLFSGSVHELLCELLQNSQRAGASRLSIDFPDAEHCVLSDNGHGLLPSRDLEGLRALLVLAESLYLQESVAANQHPMGVGLYALIANAQVRELRIRSNGLAFALETRRWLAEQDYRESWRERVEVEQGAEHGFHLTITGTPSLMQELRACLLNDGNTPRTMKRYEWVRTAMSPACGYADLLEVTLDGETLAPQLPIFLTLPKAEIVDHYQGNIVRISPFCPGEAGVCVNWYGQIVVDTNRSLGCQAYLVVRSGQPLHPMAPTRRGLIQDDALKDFYCWVRDRVFAWVYGQDRPSVALVERLYEIDAQRANSECPFALVRPWLPLPRDYVFSSNEDYVSEINDEYSAQLGPKEIVRKEALPNFLLLEKEVLVPLRGDHPAQVYSIRTDPARAGEIIPRKFKLGMTSLLRAAGLAAYSPVVGAVPTHRIWWRPGEMTDEWHTTSLGDWGMGTRQKCANDNCVVDEPPVTWQALTQGWVFVASDINEWSIASVDWIIGLETSEDLVPFLCMCGNAAFEPDEDDYDGSQEAYEQSV